MRHALTAYMDGYKRIVYCVVCGQEEPEESSECPGKYIPAERRYECGNIDNSLDTELKRS